jgi:hypothetical protein
MEITTLERIMSRSPKLPLVLKGYGELISIINCFNFKSNSDGFEFQYDGSNQFLNQYSQRALRTLISDPGVNTFLCNYKRWEENNRNTWFITGNTLEVLQNTKAKVNLSYLANIKNKSGYFEIKTNKLLDPTKEPIKSVMYYQEEYEGQTSILISYITEGNALGYLNFVYDQNGKQTIQETIEDYDFEMTGFNPHLSATQVLLEDVDNLPFATLIINLILAVNYTEQEEQQNIFSNKLSTKAVQLKTMTQLKYRKVDLELPSEYTSAEISVRGHFRWQPYGEERKLIKLIFISPFTRQIQKKVS